MDQTKKETKMDGLVDTTHSVLSFFLYVYQATIGICALRVEELVAISHFLALITAINKCETKQKYWNMNKVKSCW